MQTIDWQQVLALLPGRNPQAIIKMSWLIRTGRVNTLDLSQTKNADTSKTFVESVVVTTQSGLKIKIRFSAAL